MRGCVYGKKVHYPVLIYNDCCCGTACGICWYRPRKEIKRDEVECKACKRTDIFKGETGD